MSSRTRNHALIGLVLLATAGPLLACGPYCDPSTLEAGDRLLLAAPQADFLAELKRITPDGKAEFRAVGPKDGQTPQQQTAMTGEADLRAALSDRRIPAAISKYVLKDYAALRDAIRRYNEDMDDYRERLRWMDADERKMTAPPKRPKLIVPANLPREFDLYLCGAVSWHAGSVDTARRSWRAVLNLPPGRRKYRSVWAAYMLGRSYVKTNPAKAVKWFSRVRKLAGEGFADSPGLAAASLGWEGRAELNRKNYRRATELYMLQHKAGAKSAAASLRVCAAKMLKADEKTLMRAAKDALSRRVVTAHLLAGRSCLWLGADGITPGQTQVWLAAVEKAGVKDVGGADRLAWAAYRAGQMAAARRWVSRAPANSAIAQWVRAKLLLRAGKLDQAAAVLAKAVRALPKVKDPPADDEYGWWWRHGNSYHRRTAAGELAALKMSRRQYVEALDLLLRHHWREDAAYVAERVLTVDELAAYVDKYWSGDDAEWVRSLLARRLTRLGRWKRARSYCSKDGRKMLDEYIGSIRTGNDRRRSRAERSAAFWKAAKIVVEHGRCLLGYETGWYGKEPDGTFHSWRDDSRTTRAGRYKVAPVTSDERTRAARHQPSNVKCWHYLYEVAGHAWRACELMPDNADETARRLCEAGTWLKVRDPKAADRFYKALVLRCGSTELGRQADRLRWFPELPENKP